MNASIASILKARIQDLIFADKVGGLVRALKIVRNGVTIIRPIACDVEDPLNCDDSTLNELTPDEKYGTVMYFEDGGVRTINSRTKGRSFVSQLRLVLWVNTKQYGGGCNSADTFVHHLISALEVGTRYNTGPFIGVLHRVESIPVKGAALFGQYTYDEEKAQFLMPPYDAIAIDITTEFRIKPGCEDQVTPDDVACWTAPVSGRKKYPNEFDCEALLDPVTGLTAEQLGPDCLDCEGGGPPPPCADLTININGVEVDVVPDPCGVDVDLEVVDEDDAPIGTLVGEKWVVPNCPPPEPCVLCDLVEPASPTDVVDCVSPGNIPSLLTATMLTAEATPEAIVVAMDAASKTGGVQALICSPCADVEVQLTDSDDNNIGAPDVYPAGTVTTKTAPDGVVETTDGLTAVLTVKSNGTKALPQSVIQYKDVADADQVIAPSNTDFVGGFLRAVTQVARFIFRTTDGLTNIAFGSAAAPNVDAPQSKVLFKDEADADAVTAASDTGFSAGTMHPTSQIPRRELLSVLGVGTGLYATVGRLIANTIPAIPNVRIAKRDGTTVDVDYVKTPTAAFTETVASDVVTAYTADDTWNKPTAANYVGSWILCVGAGGGGGAGARRATFAQKTGGGGGGGGAMAWRWVPAASLAATETVTIGVGGPGGAANAVNTTAGAAGTLGGDTSFGAHVIAKGGGSGAGGSFGSVTGGANGGLASACTPARGPSALNGAARTGVAADVAATGLDGFDGSRACPSGGQGGTCTTGNVDQTVGAGGGVYNGASLIAGPAAPAAGGGTAGNNGANNQSLNVFFSRITPVVGIGTAGSGGSGNIAGAGGNGGNGGNYGAGGGGGGSSLNGFLSGAGGTGGGGLCIVMDVYA